MKQQFSRLRRFLVAFLALAVAGILFRSQIAEALVIRGDDYLYRGDHVHALERYRRALALSPSLQVAADRYVFVSMEQHTTPGLRHALTVADAYLDLHPNDAVVLSDRALCFLHLRSYALAQRDFENAARVSHAPSDLVFAGWAARRAGRMEEARLLWYRALHVRPGYRPAIVALEEQRQ